MSEFRSVNFCRVVSSFSLISLLAFSSAAMGDVARGVPFDGQELVPAIAKGQDLGATNPGQLLHVAVSLQPSWADGLQEFANAVSDPANPMYRQFMTPAEIGKYFGASQADVDAVVSHLKSNGFAIKLVAANRMAVLADGTVKQAEAAFGTQIRNYSGPSPDGSQIYQFHANNRPILLPATIAKKVIDVSGLESYTRPVPRGTTTTQLTPDLVRALYGISQFYVNPSLAGQGRTIGISNWDGFKLSNADLFITKYGLPYPAAGKHSNVQVIKIDGGSGSGRAQGEGDLDIQMELAMAPLANIKVFDGKGGDLVNVLTMEAGDASVDIISESYGWNVAASTATAAHNQHTAMTGTGKTYMAASGDSGTTLEPYSYPNYDPEVLQIGGTVATVDSVTGVRSSEVGWSGSGGGWSNNSASFNVRDGSSTSTATFQHSLTIVQGVATPNKRLVPDVALHSDGGGKGGYFFYYRGLLYTGSGTSFASPIFAGCLALSAQKLLATKSTFSGHFGRLQDWLYAHSGAAGLFFDVTIGNNGNLPSGQPSVAGSGWDFVTGLGAMNFNAFVTAY